MKTGDEVYIKSEGERAIKRRIDDIDGKDIYIHIDETNSFEIFTRTQLHLLKPNDRLVSELPEIARMTGCYVAVDKNKRITISEIKMAFGALTWAWYPTRTCGFISNLTCPNCEDYTRQWGPDGEVL